MRRRLTRLLPLFVLVVVAGAGAAMAAAAATTAATATVKTTVNKAFGTVLVGSNGHTLYRYTPDKKGGASTCKGKCLQYWPKLTVKTGTKPTASGGASSSLLGTVRSSNGQSQVTYGGYPLYFFSGDKKAGQVNGQGEFKTWYVVNTKGSLVK
jgi:predicted lipoprotein with Yx(FWY)xxD motif